MGGDRTPRNLAVHKRAEPETGTLKRRKAFKGSIYRSPERHGNSNREQEKQAYAEGKDAPICLPDPFGLSSGKRCLDIVEVFSQLQVCPKQEPPFEDKLSQ